MNACESSWRRINSTSTRTAAFPSTYKAQRIRSELKLDLVVEECVVVELKSVERLHPSMSRR